MGRVLTMAMVILAAGTYGLSMLGIDSFIGFLSIACPVGYVITLHLITEGLSA